VNSIVACCHSVKFCAHAAQAIRLQKMKHFDAVTLWRPRGFGDFWKKKRPNARGFAREFFRSGMLYRPSKSLKRHGKSSSLHLKKIFLLGVTVFL